MPQVVFAEETRITIRIFTGKSLLSAMSFTFVAKKIVGSETAINWVKILFERSKMELELDKPIEDT
jgi:hypothetical protein